MSGRLALFADCLLVGLFTLVAAVPLVTGYLALVAACAVLRDRVGEERSVGPRVYWTRLRQTVHSGPQGLLVPPLVAVLLALDTLAVAAGVPGWPALAAVLVAVAAFAAVLGLRTAARWRPQQRWPAVAAAAATDLARDPAGSLLLLLAAGCTVAIAAAVPVTVLLLPGLLALAAVAIDSRRPENA